ncbi:MAG: hypothetical protein J2P31_15820, partial [Blastocatellia bacterium]|nr:hypothetical protein [Blastocatellia bacterium]
QARRVYRATSKGRRALIAAKVKVHELFSEMLEAEEAFDGLSQLQDKTVDDLEQMNRLFSHLKIVTLPQLRRGAKKVTEPRSQAFLETAVAVVEGLVKAFNELEKQKKS